MTGIPTEGVEITPASLVVRSANELERGRAARASLLLRSAQDQYADVSPYLMAWIHVQQGIIFLRNEDYRSAKTFFLAAHQRFPQYTLAAEHLAETRLALGELEAAAELYRQVAERSGNPEFYHKLAQAALALGHESQAQEYRRMAAKGYADLLTRHPMMYADHAANYYLAMGDAETALALARQNYESRQDIRARTLLARTQAAAGDADAACAGLREIRSLGFAPPEARSLAHTLGDRCSGPWLTTNRGLPR